MNETIHVNCAGGIVYDDNKVLTINMIPQNEIIFPKGHIELGESHEQTALREVFEETGYKTKIKGFLGSLSYEFDENGNHYSKIVYYYLLELLDKSAKPTPHREIGEDFDNLWLPVNEALKLLTHEGSKDLLRKAIDLVDEETHKYVVTHFIKPIEDSTKYQTNDSPLHITLLQIFALPEKDVNKLVDSLNTVTNQISPFSVFSDKPAMFGPNKDVPVITVKRSPEILDLHLRLIKSIKSLNPRYIFPGFMEQNFSPHCTIEPNQQIKQGKEINIDSFTLLDCGVNDDGIVKVIRTFRY